MHVRFRAICTDWLGLGIGSRENSEVETDFDFTIIPFDGQLEGVIFFTDLNVLVVLHLFLQEIIKVLLGQLDWLLGEADVVEDGFQVKRPFADVVV